ncbi:MAG: hypothetical protein ACKVT2_21595 [Saprospiraceae bacterium]
MRSLLSALLVLLFVLGCKKSDDGSILFNQDQFPLKVGNWWRYRVNDLYTQSTDTLTITIVSETISGSTTEYRCALKQKGIEVDSGYFKTTNNSLEYNGLNSFYSYFGNFILQTPFNIGDKWKGIYLNDSLGATARIASFDVLGKTYEPVYTLERSGFLPGFRITQDLFLTPNVGVIYQSLDIFESSGSGQKQVFQLIDYEVD